MRLTPRFLGLMHHWCITPTSPLSLIEPVVRGFMRPIGTNPRKARVRDSARDSRRCTYSSARRSRPTDFAQERPYRLGEFLGAVVVGPVPARRGHDICAESLAEPPGDLGEEVVAVRAHDQQHGHGDGD